MSRYSRVPNTRGVLYKRGDGNPSKKLINGAVLINGGGGSEVRKNRFLRYLLETSAITKVNSCR